MDAERTEAALLAVMLREPDAIDEARVLGCGPALFAGSRHRALWSALAGGGDGATAIDRLRPAIGSKRPFPTVEAAVQHLRDLQTSDGVRYRLPAYIEGLRTARALRVCLSAATDVTDGVRSGASPDELIGKLSSAAKAATRALGASGAVSFAELVESMADSEKAERMVGRQIYTGIAQLDAVIDLREGDYALLFCPPGHGKTYTGLSLLRSAVDADPETVGVFLSTEMSQSRIARRAATRVPPMSSPRALYLGEKHIDRITSAMYTLAGSTAPRLWVIDYFQNIRSKSSPGQGENYRLQEVSKRLQGVAADVGAAVILLGQTHAGYLDKRKRRGKDLAPRINEVRDCPGIQQDLDWGLSLFNLEKYHRERGEDCPEGLRNLMQVVVRKSRDGTEDRAISLSWRKESGWVDDPANVLEQTTFSKWAMDQR